MSTTPAVGGLDHPLRAYPGIAVKLGPDGVVRESNGSLERLLGREVAGSDFGDLLDETSRPKLPELLASASADTPERWELVLVTRESLELRTFLVQAAENPPYVWLVELVRDPAVEMLNEELAAVNGDLVETQRVLTRERHRLSRTLESERAARAAAERATERITALLTITEAALVHFDLDALLARVLSVIPVALAADTATVLLIDEASQMLVVRASVGMEEEVTRQMAIPVGKGLRGGIATSGEPVIVPDLRESEMVSPFLRERVRSFMGAPLRVGGRTIGVIHVGTFELHPFQTQDLQFLELVADRVASAIERARLYDAERQARTRADAAVQARDDVLGIVSHDLRSPLATIYTAASLLLDLPVSEDDRKRHLEIIKRSADRGTRLIRDLLEVTSIEGRGLSIDRHPLEVGPLLAEAGEMFHGQAEGKGIALECTAAPDLPRIAADRDRLLQLLSNLVGNALSLTPAGGRIGITAEAAPDGVRFAVADTGPGIAPADLPHLFERFWQARRARRGGAGLGLAISKAIVEAHGGSIEVESEPGNGATFRFTIPPADA